MRRDHFAFEYLKVSLQFDSAPKSFAPQPPEKTIALLTQRKRRITTHVKIKYTFLVRLRCDPRWTGAPRSSGCESFACSFGCAMNARILLFRATNAVSPPRPLPPGEAPTPASRPSERTHKHSSKAVDCSLKDTLWGSL